MKTPAPPVTAQRPRKMWQSRYHNIWATKLDRRDTPVLVLSLDAASVAALIETVARESDPLAFHPLTGPGPRGEELASNEQRQLSHAHRKTYAIQKATRQLSAIGITSPRAKGRGK